MQKTLIALAVAGLASTSAFAESAPEVSVYGGLDGAIANISASGTKSQLLTVSDGLAPTHVGIKASDELAGGTKVIGVLEYGADSQDATNLGFTVARQKLLGLTGGWGTFAGGFLQTTGYDWAVKYDPAAESSISALQNITTANSVLTTGFLVGTTAEAARAQRALAYISPNFSGFSFALNYSTAFVGAGALGQPTGTVSPTTAYLASVGYDAGPLSVGLVYAAAKNVFGVATGNVAAGPTGVNATDMALGASYDFSVTKLSATYQSAKRNAGGASSNKAYSISDVTPVGPGNLLLQYANSSIGSSFATGLAMTGANAKSYTVGYLYPLSKKATAYAAYSRVKNGANSNAFSVANGALAPLGVTAQTLGASSTLVAVGLSYKF